MIGPTDRDECIHQLAELRRRAFAVAAESGEIASLEKAASAAKMELEADKLSLDLAVTRRNVEQEPVRYAITTLAPLISSLALVGTLAFQAWTFRQTIEVQKKTVDAQLQAAQVQARSAEDNQWREATKAITQGSAVVNGMSAIALLKPFLANGSYRAEARSLAVLLLGEIVNQDIFSDLFTASMTPQGGRQPEVSERLEYVKDTVTILRRLKRAYGVWSNQTKNVVVKGPGQPDTESPVLPDEAGRRTNNPFYARNQVDGEIGLASAFIATALRDVGPDARSGLDFSDAALWDCDLHGIVFGSADLTNLSIINADMKDADLRGVARFDGSVWNGTAWWRAKVMSRELLRFLIKQFPFSSRTNYPKSLSSNTAEYLTAVKRLEASGD